VHKNAPSKPNDLRKRLHPRLVRWFESTYPAFTHAQILAVPAVLDRECILLTSPTGSGKTLAAFLGIFDALLRKLDAQGDTRTSQRDVPTKVQCIYVSPLRALAYDIGKNIRAPIIGMGLGKQFRIHLRTGDTPASERVKFRERSAHILVTTPESLAVMLAQESYAAHLAECEFVVVDELHSFAGNKRGADLTISLERLERLCSRRPVGDAGVDDGATPISRFPQGRGYRRSGYRSGGAKICRIGLSATAAPLDVLARFLVGENRPCQIAEARTEKQSLVEVFSPIRRKPYPPSGYTGVRLYAELAELIRRRQSVLVFTNVRSAAEQVGLRLKE
jgi:ATP-dependent Lhr-like helicase